MNVRQQIDPSTTHGLDLSEFSRGLYINGAWHASRSGRVIAVTDPSTGKIIASVPDAALEDAAAAVAAASAAAEGWRETAPRKRSEILRRCFDLMVERSEMLAKLISLENGKALRDARGEVAYAHCQNAFEIARFLENHPQVASVRYPMLPSHPQFALAKKQMRLGGGIVSFELKGGLSQGRRFLDSLQMISHTPNLGDTRTIAIHPASTTHSKLTDEERAAVGITPGLIRVSAGLESIQDIMDDIDRAIAGK